MSNKIFRILTLLMCVVSLFSCSKGEEDIERKSLNLVGETSRVISDDEEMEFGVNIKGKVYSLFSINIGKESISAKNLTGYVLEYPEIALIGEFTSLTKFSENRYRGSNDKFSAQSTTVDNGGYLIRMTSSNPVGGETVQWVAKLLLRKESGGKYHINYALYATSLGFSLPVGTEVPGDNTGDKKEEEDKKEEGDKQEEGKENGSGFTLQGEVKDLIIDMDNYEVIKINNKELFSINNIASFFELKSTYSGIGQYIEMTYLGADKYLEEIDIKQYSSPDLEYSTSLPKKEGSYLVRFRVNKSSWTQYTMWVAPMVVTLIHHPMFPEITALNISCKLYSVD